MGIATCSRDIIPLNFGRSGSRAWKDAKMGNIPSIRKCSLLHDDWDACCNFGTFEWFLSGFLVSFIRDVGDLKASTDSLVN